MVFTLNEMSRRCGRCGCLRMAAVVRVQRRCLEFNKNAPAVTNGVVWSDRCCPGAAALCWRTPLCFCRCSQTVMSQQTLRPLSDIIPSEMKMHPKARGSSRVKRVRLVNCQRLKHSNHAPDVLVLWAAYKINEFSTYLFTYFFHVELHSRSDLSFE